LQVRTWADCGKSMERGMDGAPGFLESVEKWNLYSFVYVTN